MSLVSKSDILSIKPMGNPLLNSVSKMYLKNGEIYVVKRYQTFLNLFKWAVIKFVSLSANFFSISASHRIKNEINGINFCKNYSIPVPKIIEIMSNKLILEHIDGTPLDAVHKITDKKIFVNSYKEVGCLLAKIHELKACVGDCKPENIFLTNNENISMIDFDQFRFFGPDSNKIQLGQLWDFHEFLFYLGHYFPNPGHPFLKKLIESFIRGYFYHRRKNLAFKNFLSRIGSIKFIWMYLLFLTPFTWYFIYSVVIAEKNRFIYNNTKKNSY